MANYTKEQWNAKKEALMEKCYDCFAEYGLHGTGIRALAKHCGCTSNMLYTYFENLDDLIIQSTEYCMTKVEDDFMAKAPTDAEDMWRFIDEIPYWTAEKHGKKYCEFEIVLDEYERLEKTFSYRHAKIDHKGHYRRNRKVFHRVIGR